MFKYVTAHHLAVARMFDSLYQGHATVQELEEETGFHRTTVRAYVSALRKAGVLRISGWQKDSNGKSNVAIYTIGRGPDTPKTPKSHTDSVRDWRRSVKNKAFQKSLLTALRSQP